MISLDTAATTDSDYYTERFEFLLAEKFDRKIDKLEIKVFEANGKEFLVTITGNTVKESI